MGRNRAPIGYTCPDIDSTIQNLEYIRSELKELYTVDEKELLEEVENICNEKLDKSTALLEHLRRCNDTLREWGSDLEEKLEESEKEIDNLNYEIEKLRNQIIELEKQLIQE